MELVRSLFTLFEIGSLVKYLILGDQALSAPAPILGQNRAPESLVVGFEPEPNIADDTWLCTYDPQARQERQGRDRHQHFLEELPLPLP
jgi:hypothetical protein